jgi:hypothetical protein
MRGNRRPRQDRSIERDLAALADRSLAPERRAVVERAIAASPELQARLRAQRRAVAALRVVAGEEAPAGLRAKLAPDRAQRRDTHWRALAPAFVGAVTVLALALVLLGGTRRGPTVAAAALLAARAPTTPVHEPRDGDAVLPAVRAAGLTFPYWEDRLGWRAVGLRRDMVDGRLLTTVFYRRGRQRIGYTIVAGAPLPPSAASQLELRRGTVARSLSVDGRRVVTWLRRGHTCVLSGNSLSVERLLALAAWKAGGERLA